MWFFFFFKFQQWLCWANSIQLRPTDGKRETKRNKDASEVPEGTEFGPLNKQHLLLEWKKWNTVEARKLKKKQKQKQDTHLYHYFNFSQVLENSKIYYLRLHSSSSSPILEFITLSLNLSSIGHAVLSYSGKHFSLT